jgi:tetratricopeptide (TPR) repeat protein
MRWLLVIFVSFPALSQDYLQEFRTIDRKARYERADALLDYAAGIDTGILQQKAIYYWAHGKNAFWKDDYSGAFRKLDKAKTLAAEAGEDLLRAEIALDLSSALLLAELRGQSLENILEACSVFLNKGTAEQKGRGLIVQAEFYRANAEFARSREVFNKAYPFAKTQPNVLASFYNRLAAVFTETGQHDSSLYYSHKALEIAEKLGDGPLQAISQHEIAFIQRQEGELDEALRRFSLADSIWRAHSQPRYALNSMVNIIIINAINGHEDVALKLGLRAWNTAHQNKWYGLEAELALHIINQYTHFGLKDSVHHFENVRNQAMINQITNSHAVNTQAVETLFEQKENEKLIREQQVLLDNEQKEKEIIKEERRYLILIASLCLLLVILGVFIAWEQRKRKVQVLREKLEKDAQNKQLT